MTPYCPWCRGAGCIICDQFREEIARRELESAIQRRREAEAREFLDRYLNADNPNPNVRILPHDQTVHLAMAAIEHGKQSVRRKRVEAPDLAGLERRFAMLEIIVPPADGEEADAEEEAYVTPEAHAYEWS